MSNASLNREVALRVALAARTLETVTSAELLEILGKAIGLPPGRNKLATLPLDKFRQAGGDALRSVAPDKLALAHLYLRGELPADQAPPAPQAYNDGDMPGSIRVACASDTGEGMNGHFGSCARFLIYQVSADEVRLIAVRTAEAPEDADDKTAWRAKLIADCQVLFLISIGGPAAAKVVNAGVHPIKRPEPAPARDLVAGLQGVLKGTPPPWLAKVIGQSPEERVRFDLEAPE